jgi:hypothetical protein
MSLPDINFYWLCSIKLLWAFKITLISHFPSIKVAQKNLVEFSDMSSIDVHVPIVLP